MSADKPTTEARQAHAWIWQRDAGGNWTLVDIEYTYLAFVSAMKMRSAKTGEPVDVPSAGTRTLIAAAPEMEALLRHVAAEVLPGEYIGAAAPRGVAEAAQELISHLDEARHG